jgi:hypothetical protein
VVDYIKTITVAVNIFGPEPTEKWSTSATTSLALIWGQDKWGYGTVGLPLNFTKGIANSVSSDSNIARIFYVFPVNAMAMTSVVGKGISHYYTNAVANTSAVGKNLDKYVLSTFPVTTTIGKNIYKEIYDTQTIAQAWVLNSTYNLTIANGVNCLTGQTVYKYRDGFTVTYGGQAEIGLWPRGSSYTIAAGTTTSWTVQSAASGTWS